MQSILLKTALIFGVKVFTGVTFEKIIEPINEEEGWKCSVTPSNQSVSDFEIDVLIGADGKKNVLPGFAQIEMRGNSPIFSSLFIILILLYFIFFPLDIQ